MSKRYTPTSSGQQTLFDCVQRRKQSSDDGDDSASVSPSYPGQQGNFVTIQDPTRSTIIVINADAFAGTATVASTLRAQSQSSTDTAVVPSTSQQPPSDIASGPHKKPVQPSRLIGRFPSTLVGTKKRSFNPDWFKTYNWLEYSVEREAAFCFPCRHFSTGSGRVEDTFQRSK